MVFDDEMDFELNENTTSKNTEPQLEKYGVWIKKGPETLESPQETTSEILDIPDVPDTTDFSDISVMDDDIISSENEQIESINDEINSLIDTNPVAEENSSIIDNSIEMPQIENDIIDTPTEPEIPADLGLPEGFDIPGIDLSAFENNDVPAPKVAEPEGEVSIDMDDFFSSDSGDGEVDLSSFFGDGESIDFDDFMSGDSGGKKEPEIVDQEPLDIQLEFDDNFVLETKADSLSQVEFIGLDGESGEMSFDDLFDNIQDEGAISASDFDIPGDTSGFQSFDPSAFETEDLTSAFMSDSSTPETPVAETKSSDTVYDDASEFDDLLSSLDEATPLTDTPEEAKTKKLTQDYDLTVTMDEEDLSEDDGSEEDETENDFDDISLFESNEDIENFKQQIKNNGAPVGGMKVLEAQSAMDFDEIDNILNEGGLFFPSDEEKEETTEEVSITDENEISLDDVQLEAPEQETIIEESIPEEIIADSNNEFISEIEEPVIEDSIDEDTDSTIDFEPEIEEPVIEDSIDEDTEPTIDFEPEIEEPVIEDSIEEDTEPTIDFEPEIEEPVIEDSIEEDTEPTIDFEPEIEEPVIEDSIEEDADPTIDFEPEIEEPVIEDSIEEETEPEIEETVIESSMDEALDESFNTMAEIEEEPSATEETQESFQNTEDNLLDMDFADSSILETTENPETQDSIEEQGETMDQINENSQINSQTENQASSILEKIASEISCLRSEISTLRSEFNSLKTGPVIEDEVEDLEEKDEDSGFFSDDNDDETIALSGDELNNILNNADFTEEESEGEDSIDPVEETEEEFAEPEVESEITEPEVQEEPEEEVPVNPLGDATELADSDLDTMDEYEEDNFAEDSETSDFADEDLTEPALEDLQINNDFDDNDEEVEDEIDIPKDEEVLEEQESNDFIDSINEVEPTISETLTEDRLKYLEDLAGEEKEEIEEPVVEESSIEEPTIDEPELAETEETEEVIEEVDEEDEHNEPTEDVFNSSQWDNEVPTVEGVIAETEETIEEPEVEEVDEVQDTIEETQEEVTEDIIVYEPVTEPEVAEETVVEEPIAEPEAIKATTEVASPTPSAQPATAKIQDDIKSVLVYMDQLLENLPEDKIEEFAKSEHFDTYKKLFNELGISN